MDVIVFHPLEALVELLIQVLQVAQVTQARVTNRSRHTDLISSKLQNHEAGNLGMGGDKSKTHSVGGGTWNSRGLGSHTMEVRQNCDIHF